MPYLAATDRISYWQSLAIVLTRDVALGIRALPRTFPPKSNILFTQNDFNMKAMKTKT